jgi:hypothetical protein
VKFCAEEDTPGNKSLESESSDDDLQTNPRDGYVLSYRRYLSGAQREKVIALIQKIKPEVTVFVSIIRKSNIQASGAYLVSCRVSAGCWAMHFSFSQHYNSLDS